MTKKLVGRVPVASLGPGAKRRLPYPPFDVLVANVDGEVYAIEDACNHAGASLADGPLRGCQITCPMHGYVFDVRTGELIVPRGLCGNQRTFRVERVGDDWVVYDTFGLPFRGIGGHGEP